MNKVSTESVEMYLDSENILRVKAHEGATLDLDQAKKDLEIMREVAGDKKVYVISNISGARAMSVEARNFVSEVFPSQFLAAALIIGNPVSRIIGNFFIGLNRADMKSRLFTSEEKALNWIRKLAKEQTGD